MLLIPLLVVLAGLLLVRARQRGNASAHAAQAPVAVYVVGSAVAGAAAGFIALEAYYGILVAALGALLIVRQTRRQRWFSLGGFLLGMGACAAGLLSDALTNRDPAVSYNSSTAPFFWIGLAVALGGAALIVLASSGQLPGSSRRAG